MLKGGGTVHELVRKLGTIDVGGEVERHGALHGPLLRVHAQETGVSVGQQAVAQTNGRRDDCIHSPIGIVPQLRVAVSTVHAHEGREGGKLKPAHQQLQVVWRRVPVAAASINTDNQLLCKGGVALVGWTKEAAGVHAPVRVPCWFACKLQ